jgi:nucleoid-associated protein YgaU
MTKGEIMKFRTIAVAGIIALICCAVFAGSASAQEKMTKEQWQSEMTSNTKEQTDLTATLDQLTKEVEALKQTLADLNKKIADVNMSTAAQRKAFEDQLGKIEAWIDMLSKLTTQDLYVRKTEIDSVQAALDAAKAVKLSSVAPYFDRVSADQQKIDALKASIANVSTEKTYVVGTWAKDRDCLWNISKKKDIYANPFMWPKIWQGNRDQIKDPDIIHPGQKLKIPEAGPLTAVEKKAVRNYWSAKGH